MHNFVPRLAERADQTTSTLSGAEQQILVIGCTLMTNPRLLVPDETAEGLAPVIRKEIRAAIGQLKCDGLSRLIVDKTFAELLSLADACVITERGQSVWHGSPTELTLNTRTRYLGL